MAPIIPIDFTGQRELKKFLSLNTGSGELMGKTRKISKGYSSVFVPDYRHAVEAVAATEGFGSSGCVGAELTALQNSSVLKRECINLNVNGYDRFGVPMRVLSLSGMSHFERCDLVTRFKIELEQVRMLQRKIASLTLDAIMCPINNKANSNENGPKGRVMVESLQMSTNDVAMVKGRKKYPAVKNGPRIKGGGVAARRTESEQGLPQSSNFVMLIKQCETLLTRLMGHQDAWIFNEPVDIVKHNIPDYFNVIKHPMDLGTIKTKLLSGQYYDPMGFAADVRLTFKNASTYNPAGHVVHEMAKTMNKYFETKWRPIEKKIPATVDESIASKSSVITEPDSTYLPPTKKQRTTTMENKAEQEPDKKGMSDFEKQKLVGELEDLMEELPDNIIDFLKETSLNGSQICEDELEIDIDAFNGTALLTLRKLLDGYLLEKPKSRAKLMPCEIEIRNESRFSNLSAQHIKDLEPADEEVNIGGDDLTPITDSIPVEIGNDADEEVDIGGDDRSRLSDSISVEIDKDAARWISNCSNSSNFSHESSSSSSDSARSADELDVANNSFPASNVNETEGLVENKESCGRGPNRGELSNSQAEQNARSNSYFIEPDSHREGESGLPERQVSPEKIYRAALLRSRFADIIIKAQENTIEKGERTDPEKLKFEKEELERRIKEEKARLQSEAKAAEEARRKAEEEAAAEAKRKRELEREAARQALQKMEKTVDIDESSQFMEDLEMFGVAPNELLLEDGSPQNSRNGLCSFKFPPSSNPLEQLGLFMKNEEDDDEQVEPQSSPDILNDPEGDNSD